MSKTETRFEAMLEDLTGILSASFRTLPADAREEAVAEAVALAFGTYCSLADKGKEQDASVHTLAWYAAKMVRQGRSIGSAAASNDVLHMSAARRAVRGVLLADDIDAATVESRKASPADLAAFRIDFAEFLGRLTDRQRGVANRLAAGFTTGEVARVYGISAAAISQHRRALESLWIEFQGL